MANRSLEAKNKYAAKRRGDRPVAPTGEKIRPRTKMSSTGRLYDIKETGYKTLAFGAKKK